MAIDSTQAAITTFRDQISKVGWRHLASNIGVAFLFFLTLFQTQLDYGSSLANWIWLGGAALMGVLVLVRVPPRSSMVTASTLLATGVSIVLPALIHPERPSHGLLAGAAIVVELCGVTLGQVGRIYLGRRFALLPADRGIVTNGPFRFVRHPIYAGWLILSIGYVMAFPTIRNGLIIMVTLPFILWRCLQEEALLSGDPNYCDYLARTRWRLVPGIY
ncbi:MAG TPA: isoprenylcysteine carboxylmethyltransferase family protein [Candidatus Binataceae bacterium]|nr:isoprenylcysteine carboxylmethyltransferase family protein [Candidatus Binataceae bacterium]